MQLVLDLPTLSAEQPPVLARLAVFADPWPGPVAVWTSGDGLSYQPGRSWRWRRRSLARRSTILPAGPTGRWQHTSFRVQLYGGALASVSDTALFGGANAAAVQRADGAWEVLQFANAELVADRTYSLSRLLRGQAGSEWAMAALLAGGRTLRAARRARGDDCQRARCA